MFNQNKLTLKGKRYWNISVIVNIMIIEIYKFFLVASSASLGIVVLEMKYKDWIISAEKFNPLLSETQHETVLKFTSILLSTIALTVQWMLEFNQTKDPIDDIPEISGGL